MVYDHIEITIKQKRHRATKCGHWACRPFSCGHPLFRLPSRWSGTSIVATEANHQRQAFLRCNPSEKGVVSVKIRQFITGGTHFLFLWWASTQWLWGICNQAGCWDNHLWLETAPPILMASLSIKVRSPSYKLVFNIYICISINYSLDIPRVNHSYYSCKPM